jgi:asparagine synthase (glutamine-hydrolysing)
MCGIVGWIRPRGELVDVERVRVANTRIRHRGPDDEGYLAYSASTGLAVPYAGRDTHGPSSLSRLETPGQAGNCVIAHRRLSIIDLTAGGHQPMGSDHGRYWITYNGEIYNYIELRRELQALGVNFRSESDTEVLLAGFAVWGERLLPRLTGMFAFAVLDARERTLTLARDHFGIKPLYYVAKDGHFAFASEVKALLTLPFVSRRADAQRTYQLLRFGERSCTGKTLLTDIQLLPAAHHCTVSLDTAHCGKPQRFWTMRDRPRIRISQQEAAERLRSLLRDSVRLHLRSDVPVGACLSGGLDSSALVKIALEQLPAGSAFHAFSFLSEDSRFSEEPWVDMIDGPIVHKTRPTSLEFANEVTELVGAQDLPFMNLGVYAQHRVFRLARDAGIKVMLDGQGSDELFGGYASSMGCRLTSLIAAGRYLDATRFARHIPNTVPLMRFRTLASSLGRQLPSSAQLRLIDMMAGGLFPRWMKREWFADRDVVPAVRPHGRGRNAFHDEILLSVEQLTLPQLLRYEDSNSMHFSIESRVPFCTPAVAEFAASLPDELLVSVHGVTKQVLRDAVSGIVPDAIIRREKLGFHAPDRVWLRAAEPIVMQWLPRENSARLPFLNLAEARAHVCRALASGGFWPPEIWTILGLAGWAAANDITWD